MKIRYPLVLISILTLTFSGAFLSVNKAQAQTIPVSISGLQLSSDPESPIPGENVTITAKSYAFNINGATITWSVNGVAKKTAIGLVTFTTTAPALGKTMTIKVSANTVAGQQYNESFSIKSGSIDFITESSGYVPPLFLGRVPLVYQNTVRIVAVPHIANSSGVEYLPSTLIYKWEKDSGTVLEDQSGYGKSFVDLKGDMVPRPYSLTVTVTTKDGTSNVVGTVSVIPHKPGLGFYINDPLYGPLYNRSVSVVNIGTQKEVSVLAVPFGFEKALNSLGNLALDWYINGTQYAELSTSNTVVLRSPDGSSGTSDVSLNISNNGEILQSASGDFTSNFGGGTSTNN